MKAFLARLKFALDGWVYFFKKETNGKIQAVISLLVVSAAFVFSLSNVEWILVLLCIGCVLAFEMVNTAVETLADRLHPDRHPDIKIVKDVAAGAVLWVSVVSIVIGGFIFLPKLWNILFS